MELYPLIPSFNKNFLFLDNGALWNEYLQIALHGCLTRKTRTFP